MIKFLILLVISLAGAYLGELYIPKGDYDYAFIQYIPMIIGAIQGITGLIQSTSKRNKPQRQEYGAEYEIPQEVYDVLDIYKGRIGQGLPAKDIIQSNLVSNAQAQMTNLKDVAQGASLLGQTANLSSGVLSGLREIDILDAQYREKAVQEYAGAVSQLAGYKDRQWDVNVNQPYLEALNEYYNRRNASQQNMMTGLSTMASGAMTMYSNDKIDELLNTIWGGGETGVNPGGNLTSSPERGNTTPDFVKYPKGQGLF